jgi:hypothetical protein
MFRAKAQTKPKEAKGIGLAARTLPNKPLSEDK